MSCANRKKKKSHHRKVKLHLWGLFGLWISWDICLPVFLTAVLSNKAVVRSTTELTNTHLTHFTSSVSVIWHIISVAQETKPVKVQLNRQTDAMFDDIHRCISDSKIHFTDSSMDTTDLAGLNLLHAKQISNPTWIEFKTYFTCTI